MFYARKCEGTINRRMIVEISLGLQKPRRSDNITSAVDSDAVLQAIETNTAKSIRIVSDELSISVR